MNHVDSLDVLGVPARQKSCMTGNGAPTSATRGAVGEMYMDTNTGKVYKCIAEVEGMFIWVDIEEKLGDIETALDTIIALQDELVGGAT